MTKTEIAEIHNTGEVKPSYATVTSLCRQDQRGSERVNVRLTTRTSTKDGRSI